jgi:transcriptional regulator of acetoin/glycerol metabolism
MRHARPALAALPVSKPDQLGDAERQALLAVLDAQHWHISHAAEQLGISRNTLYRKLRKHGIAKQG